MKPRREKKTGKKDRKGGDKKKRKAKKRGSSSSSSSSDSEDTEETSSSKSSASSNSSRSSSSSSRSSTEGEATSRRKKQGKQKNTLNWDLINETWPKEQRPKHLQSKKVVSSISLGKLLQYKEHYEREAEKKGLGEAIFGKDTKMKKTKFKKMTDDGKKKLHPARFCRLPLAQPKKYWRLVPKRRSSVFRHFPLQHYGVEGCVSEQTIVRMHDRQVPVEMDAFVKAGLGKEKQEELSVTSMQLAALNYAVIMHALCPTDFSPLVLMRVLVESKWGAAGGSDEKTRTRLVKKFFNEVVKENSGRAVRGEPPLDYEQCRAKWARILESLYPSMALLGGQQAAPAAGGKQTGGSSKSGGGSGGKGGGQSGWPPKSGGGMNTPPAKVNGVPVCYKFNQVDGCKGRDRQGPNACKDAKGNVYSHFCNWFDSSSGKHCLKPHSRVKNH